MKKINLFLAITLFILMYSCREGGRSDKYGHSKDTVFTSGQNPNDQNGTSSKVNYTAGGRPEPDTSSYYEDSKKKK